MNNIKSVIYQNVAELRLKAQKPRELIVEVLLTEKHSNTVNQGPPSHCSFQNIHFKPPGPVGHSFPNGTSPVNQKQQTNTSNSTKSKPKPI